jgi:hypothetical protein
MERAIPSDAEIERFLAGINPDVVIVSPLVDRSAYQTDYLKSARALGIPTVLCVSSWDNLTSKGLIRIVPNRVMVWNETQRREAVGLHHVDPDRVVTTGAQQFDHWFGRGPTTAREAFLARFGLPPDRPLVLFAASTRQGAAAALEPAFVARWLDELRRSGDEGTRNASVLIRPHPTDLERWDEPGIDLRGAVIWHRDLPLPIGDDARAQYFDALHHCDALVAINSSAMIEAAIVDRPVHTICLPALRPLQHDLLHFHYLLVANGGFLRAASSFEEHVSLLARTALALWRASSGRTASSARPTTCWSTSSNGPLGFPSTSRGRCRSHSCPCERSRCCSDSSVPHPGRHGHTRGSSRPSPSRRTLSASRPTAATAEQRADEDSHSDPERVAEVFGG